MMSIWLLFIVLIGSDKGRFSVNAQSDFEPDSSSNSSDAPPREEWFPSYHVAPPYGWMNDPNGLIYFEGYYHAFYQYNPYATYADNIHWGHVRSKNMLHWENLPIALAPSIPEDKDGCFTGSAVNNDGVMTLLYTGNADVEVQCIATTNDTIHFAKGGEVLGAPPGIPDFRDPKVFRVGDAWYMVVGASDNNVGQTRLYSSKDLYQWQSHGVLAKSDGRYGYMWECPDFFTLDDGDKYVFMVSPQGVKPDGYKYRNLYQSGYFIGDWAPGKNFTILKDFVEIDNGFDFYAPQSFLTPDNRRVQIGWMDMWETPMPERDQGWVCQLTLPRELTMGENDRVLINPIREVEDLRHGLRTEGRSVLYNEQPLLECNVTTLEIIMTWDTNSSNAIQYGLHLGDVDNPEEGIFFYVDNEAQRLTLDRRYPRYGMGLVGYRSIELPQGKILKLRVFFDKSSIEVFVNDGEAVLSSRIYPLQKERCLSLFANDGRAILESSSRWQLSKKQ